MRTTLLLLLLGASMASTAQNVTIHATERPAAEVFRTLVEQTGKNFVYSSDLLQGMEVTVDAHKRPLKLVLNDIFRNTDIQFRIRGNNVVLKRRPTNRKISATPHAATQTTAVQPPELDAKLLDEVVVVSRLESPAVETAEIGAKKVTADEVRETPALFGEPDVIKALQTQPGVTEATEGMAGMVVHGGNGDENLHMLDNVPIYQVNHFAGLFSAFNTDIIRYIDFFKSSMPAKYDGRLSSFMDVRLRNGNREGHHGSARLGITSGAFNISGPIGGNTSYLVGLRRSWFDLLSIPALAIINSKMEEKVRFHYYFMDLNAKVSHRFSNRSTAFVSVYFGNDKLLTGSKDEDFDGNFNGSVENYKHNYHWGNLIAQAGLNHRLTPDLSAEFTAAYTRFFSDMEYHEIYKSSYGTTISCTDNRITTHNNVNDWIFRADFDWQPSADTHVRFGGGYVRHSFLPAQTTKSAEVDEAKVVSRDSTWAYHVNEANIYIEDDWRVTDRVRVNAGVHASLFNIDSRVHYGISPRLSVSYRPTENMAIKAAYSRTVQYVHQLSQSYMALPTDQWIPITGRFKPQTADKIALGAYWQTTNKVMAVSLETYYKWMHNLLDYRDEYYLKPPLEMWNARLTQGRGTARGIDLKVEKLYGRFTGHIAYSLAWANRTFADKNGGATFPARFDHRHTIKLFLNWNISPRVAINASWTGHSGNRFTLLTQTWHAPTPTDGYVMEMPLRSQINNYRLPFYHRLDLSCTVRNSRGYWVFGLYNAYNHMNTLGIRRSYKDIATVTSSGVEYESRPVFQKIKLLPIIPSISYTWEF